VPSIRYRRMSQDALQPQSVVLPLPRRRRESIAGPFLVFSTLLFFFLIPDVAWRIPIYADNVRKGWISWHQQPRNTIFAQKLIEKRLDAPVTRWWPTVASWEVGNGVWYAKGDVGVRTPAGQEIRIPWRIYFFPGVEQPLYVSVDSREEGSIATALDQAGNPAEHP
jgi:hypothetical protein